MLTVDEGCRTGSHLCWAPRAVVGFEAHSFGLWSRPEWKLFFWQPKISKLETCHILIELVVQSAGLHLSWARRLQMGTNCFPKRTAMAVMILEQAGLAFWCLGFLSLSMGMFQIKFLSLWNSQIPLFRHAGAKYSRRYWVL